MASLFFRLAYCRGAWEYGDTERRNKERGSKLRRCGAKRQVSTCVEKDFGLIRTRAGGYWALRPTPQ